MKPFRKPFFGDPLFPFEIVYKTEKRLKNELPNHLHDRYELVYIHQGKGAFFIDNKIYEKKSGDLFTIPGNTIHYSLPSDDDPIISSVLYFAPMLMEMGSLDDSYSHLLCYDLAKKYKTYKLELSDHLLQLTEITMERIFGEVSEHGVGYREAVRLLTCELLLQLNRSAVLRMQLDTEVSRLGPSWFRDALHEIDQHPDREIKLSTLALHAKVSASHFSRVFKQLTSMNVTDYVNAKRIIRAKEILLHSDENISLIADQCGFDNPTHFHRVFKNFTGITPNSYRKRDKNFDFQSPFP